MDILTPSFSYILLTDKLPTRIYELSNGYALKTVESTPEMLRGFFTDIGEKYNALMSFPHIDNNSFYTYQDLVIFHSFISGNPNTYEFAENAAETSYMNSKLTFIDIASNTDLGKITTLDFDHFPLTTELDTTKPKVQYINYKEAFNLFSKLKSNNKTKKLYNLICLYVFARSLEYITKIYSNTYIAISFYITILESIIGKPPTCNKTLECPTCGALIPNHLEVSLTQHFINHYGKRLNNLRNIRHKTFHTGEYSDFWQSFTSVRRNEGKLGKESEKYLKFFDQIMDFEDMIQEKLINLFLENMPANR